jgi:hypothetical protein
MGRSERKRRRELRRTRPPNELRDAERKIEMLLLTALFVVVLTLAVVLTADAARTREALADGPPRAGYHGPVERAFPAFAEVGTP